jgi:hypothetical protein
MLGGQAYASAAYGGKVQTTSLLTSLTIKVGRTVLLHSPFMHLLKTKARPVRLSTQRKPVTVLQSK